MRLYIPGSCRPTRQSSPGRVAASGSVARTLARLATRAQDATMQNFSGRESGLNPMHILRFGMAVAAAIFVLPVNAQNLEIGPGGVRVGRGECEQLRRACQNKEALGEQGEGNCRRYHLRCGDSDDDEDAED